MATHYVQGKRASMTLVCQAFTISQSCYRYEAKNDAENDTIAEWLMRLTDNHRHGGFGLCFLYLRNVKGFAWNHKRVYRVYKALALNLRTKPRKRLVRALPQLFAELRLRHVKHGTDGDSFRHPDGGGGCLSRPLAAAGEVHGCSIACVKSFIGGIFQPFLAEKAHG
jgi:hypothetical protein